MCFYVLLIPFSVSLVHRLSVKTLAEWLLRPWQQISLSAISRERLARLLSGTYLGIGPVLEAQSRGGGIGEGRRRRRRPEPCG